MKVNKFMYIGELYDDIKPERIQQVYPNCDFYIERIGNTDILRGRHL